MAAQPDHASAGSDEEELAVLAPELRAQDPLMDAKIRRTIGSQSFSGRVVDIEVGVVSGERLYRVRYCDGDMEHFTAEQVKEFQVPESVAPAAKKKEKKKAAATPGAGAGARTPPELHSKFALREVGPGCQGLVATADIAKGEVVFEERPFYAESRTSAEKYSRGLARAGRPELDAELGRLRGEIVAAAREHSGKEAFGDRYPPSVRVHLDRFHAFVHELEFAKQPPEVQHKWMALHDAHQDVPRDRASAVAIFGLRSEKGQSLNGCIAEARRWHADRERFEVRLGEETLLLRRENLKTPAGVVRSNSFDEGLFELRCRMNHACRPNTQTTETRRQKSNFLIVAVRRILAGEEITCSYTSAALFALRQDELWEKYRFRCRCEACERGEDL